MSKQIQLYRHHESIKDPNGEKIPTKEGLEKSLNDGHNAWNNNQEATVRGYHTSAARTELALDAYLAGTYSGTKEQSSIFENVNTPKEMGKLRKELGDNEISRIRLDRYDKDPEPGESKEFIDHYIDLYEKGKSIADKVSQEIEGAKKDPSKNEIVVAYSHEPILSISLVELAKKYLGHDGKNNAEKFKELSGNNSFYTLEGTGYSIEVDEDGKTFLITNAGRFELKETSENSELEKLANEQPEEAEESN